MVESKDSKVEFPYGFSLGGVSSLDVAHISYDGIYGVLEKGVNFFKNINSSEGVIEGIRVAGSLNMILMIGNFRTYSQFLGVDSRAVDFNSKLDFLETKFEEYGGLLRFLMREHISARKN